jgi:acyl-lipid omega-6 desaturase (Delta-12 desaturase)
MDSEKRVQLRAAVIPFETSETAKAVLQLFTSLGLYIVVIALMYRSLSCSYFLTLALAPIAGGLLIRTFIVQHDCGHGAFFHSQRANDLTGAILGLFTLAPYQNWRRQHAQHHSNWNNLDRRESGADIYSACLTVEEYRALTVGRKFSYRLVRHPLVAHLIIPPLVFLLLYRFAFDTPRDWIRERRSVYLTNLCVAAAYVAMGYFFGFGEVLMVQLPVFVVTTVIGVWLFSVQHRFDCAHWLRQSDWNFQDAAMKGTSYLKLPALLQWFTGNIGFHHIHHLSPRVPNYRLQACHNANAILSEDPPLTLSRALGAVNLTLWDEADKRLVRFCDVR